jgi:microcystin-dependent protein
MTSVPPLPPLPPPTVQLATNGGQVAQGYAQYLSQLDTQVRSGNFPALSVNGVSVVPVGVIEWWPTNVLQAGRLKCNGASYPRTAPYDKLFACLVNTAPVTIAIGAPGVVTWNNHGLSANDAVKLFTTGSLPTGLTAGAHGLATVGTVYYVVAGSITTNAFQLAASPGGAPVNTSGTQSGTQTAVVAPWGDGDGATTFTVPDLRGQFARAWDDGAGVDANRLFGSHQTDAMQGHIHTVGQPGNAGILAQTGGSGSYWYTNTGLENASGPVTDGTNGTPRTAAETRPTNYALMPTIRYA